MKFLLNINNEYYQRISIQSRKENIQMGKNSNVLPY